MTAPVAEHVSIGKSVLLGMKNKELVVKLKNRQQQVKGNKPELL